MLIVGLDAAADLANFGYAVVREDGNVLRLIDSGCLGRESHLDSTIGRHLRSETRALVSVDAPLGWPSPLGNALSKHSAGQELPVPANQLFRRSTDLHIKSLTKKQPLDIGADRIARAAWSALNVLGALRRLLGEALPMVWEPDFEARVGVIEVYPGATLAGWGLRSDSYKQDDQVDARRSIAGFFGGRAPWLSDLVQGKVDVFDAGLCTIAASDFLTGLAGGPPDRALAELESWIWVRTPVRSA